jgi:hypothetical protein
MRGDHVSDRELFDPDAAAGAKNGRGYPYTTIGNWILLRPDLSDRAVRVYCLLRMHANQHHGDRCWPSQLLLADLLGLAKPDAITKAVRELVDIGAVQVETVRAKRGRMNVYTVHESPPDDWAGPVTQDQFRRSKEQVSGGHP